MLNRPVVLFDLIVAHPKTEKAVFIARKGTPLDAKAFERAAQRRQRARFPTEMAQPTWQRGSSQIQQLRELKARSKTQIVKLTQRDAKIEQLKADLSLTSDATSESGSSSTDESHPAIAAHAGAKLGAVLVKHPALSGPSADAAPHRLQRVAAAYTKPAPSAAVLRMPMRDLGHDGKGRSEVVRK